MTQSIEATIIKERIDQYWEDNQDDGLRHHLGGSLIGRECSRELWYSFRWATLTRHTGRILRLFNRGHHEEPRMVEWLRQIGCIVHETDPDTGDQFRIIDVDGHFGGSLDGIAYNVPGVDQFGLTKDDPVLLEFKTHGQKSFDELTKKGLEEAKAEHVAQMQTYMVKRGIKVALYMPICKNTDELYPLWLPADNMAGAGCLSKAGEIISAPKPPNRISNNPSWFKCRFCDHRGTCHLGKPMEMNCRTCTFSKPIEDGQWYCAKWESVIPKESQKAGCSAHHMITD